MTDQENLEIFDSLNEESTKLENENIDELEEVPEEVSSELEFEFGELSDNVKKEVILKEEDYEKVFVIEKVELGKPQLKDADGVPIPPKQFNEKDPTKKGYVTKLKIEYKDNNYISLIPNVKWYIASRTINGVVKKILNPWFRTAGLKEEDLEDKFVSEASKLYYRFCKYKGIEPGKMSQSEFVSQLVGQKVKIRQWKEKYKGEMSYRIDIVEFVN